LIALSFALNGSYVIGHIFLFAILVTAFCGHMTVFSISHFPNIPDRQEVIAKAARDAEELEAARPMSLR
jgi:hypothetical protein